MNAAARTILAATMILVPLPWDARAREAPQGWAVTVGASLIHAPAYLGADTYELLAVPNIEIAYADKFFLSMRDGTGYNVINRNGWRIGPVARYEFGRREDGDSPFRVAGKRTDDLRGLGDVDGTAELGGFVEYSLEDFTARAVVQRGIGGHGAVVAEADVRYSRAIMGFGPPIIVSIGPNLKFAGSKFNDAYFGIDAGQAARSGLTRYSAGSGLVTYGLGGVGIVPIVDRVSMAVFAGYDRMASAAADSPLVRVLGSKSQAAIGISIGYEYWN